MQKHSAFTPIHTILIPLIHEGPGMNALEFARHFDAEIILVGIVVVPPDKSLSVGAVFARALRKQLRLLGKDERITSKTQIIVSYQPWTELSNLLQKEKPDLLCLEWDSHLSALGVTTNDVLTRPPCDVALVRGKISSKLNQVLVPVRGGPHAELSLRVGLGLHPKGVTALHIRRPDDPDAGSDAPFKGLDRVLKQMPDVRKQFTVTDDAAQLILEHAKQADIIVLGTTSQPVTSSASLGVFADKILNEAPCAVIAVKSGRPMPHVIYDEGVGVQAISILVDKWFAENTFHADEFKQLDELLELKRQQGVTISLALPALNEETTVGNVIHMMKKELMEKVPLLDEIILIDSNSTDRTREIAEKEDIPIYIHQHLLKRLGARRGKGEALWKSLLVTRGDIIVWIDTDIMNIHPRFVYGIIGPLLLNAQVQFVKGFYRRPLKVGEKMQAGGGGRVTELAARPLLNLFYPELSGVIQPLSGEYGGRREALERAVFFSGYGVETGLLIDIYERYGLNAIAQVDLLERIHHNQPLEALSKMSFAIIQTVIRKLESRFGRAVLEDVNKSMKLIRYDAKGYSLDIEEIAERERPAMIEIQEYLERKR
ncbi:MAG: glucosyl-3-phosphoglycerate synthase [Anaerolineae bacterium CG_4_9_14_3_um_filter_57_17]|nr:glucosyl-3-phosphoglycerate synthase [bacterium]NCT21920.1 glucosyl-3-phosphoglycerate synthase [bacterium]PJB65960.1 MAG: glucosyl-3-phosphoglycerate synthase [Anaerolineae bacterium CG_4_9_14_3_um_filter_57_17]